MGFGQQPSVLEKITALFSSKGADVAAAQQLLTPALMQQVVERIQSVSSPKFLLHALVMHAFFCVAGISSPQLLAAIPASSSATSSTTTTTNPPQKSGTNNNNQKDGAGAATTTTTTETDRQQRHRESVRQASARMPPSSAVSPVPPMVLAFFRFLSEHFEPRLRYYLLHACVHHLRVMGSAETTFFAEVLLHLFATPANVLEAAAAAEAAAANNGAATPESGTRSGAESPRANAAASTSVSSLTAASIKEAQRLQIGVQEQILRVVLERCLTHRPRPAALTNTLQAIIQHPEFNGKDYAATFRMVLSTVTRSSHHHHQQHQQHQQQQQQQEAAAREAHAHAQR